MTEIREKSRLQRLVIHCSDINHVKDAVDAVQGNYSTRSVVADDVPLMISVLSPRLLWSGEKELSGSEAEESTRAAYTILGSLERIIGSGFRGVVCAEYGDMIGTAKTIQPDQSGSVEVVFIRIHPKEDYQWVYHYEVEREHLSYQPLKCIHRIFLEVSKVDPLVVDHGLDGYLVQVEPSQLGCFLI